MPRPLLLSLGMGFCLTLASAAQAVPPSPQPMLSIHLRVEIFDGETRASLPARLQILGADGQNYYPLPRSAGFYHEAYFGHRYFYADGSCEVDVPPGPTTIRVSHGFEYEPLSRVLELDSDRVERFDLVRVVDMPALGWRSGDTHIHMAHGGLNVYTLTAADLFLMQRAEDLHVANVLENGLEFSGAVHPLSNRDYFLFFGIEYRSAFWGHLGILGTRGLTPFGCCSLGQPAYPMNIDLAATARQLGGTIVFAHPITMARDQMFLTDRGWPSVGHGRSLPIDVALGAVDAMDVMSYSNRGRIELPTWYDLLNHGFHLPATAGTDASVNRFIDPPLGGYRVYARVGRDWDYDSWLTAIRRGESFLTNGPLIRDFRVADRPAGDVVPLAPGQDGRCRVYYDAVSAWPILYAVVIVNGRPAMTLVPRSADAREMKGLATVLLPGGSVWVALKVVGRSNDGVTIGPELVAHTSPVYLDLPSRPVRFGGVNPRQYVDWVDEVLDLAQLRGFTSTTERDLVMQRGVRARDILFDRTILSPNKEVDPGPLPEESVPGAETRAMAPVVTAWPNPSRGAWSFRFGAGSAPEMMELFDVNGRRLAARRVPLDDVGAGGWLWDAEGQGLSLAPGVYFAVFRGSGWTRSLRLIRQP